MDYFDAILVRLLTHGTILVRLGTILLPMIRVSSILVLNILPDPKSYLNNNKPCACFFIFRYNFLVRLYDFLVRFFKIGTILVRLWYDFRFW